MEKETMNKIAKIAFATVLLFMILLTIFVFFIQPIVMDGFTSRPYNKMANSAVIQGTDYVKKHKKAKNQLERLKDELKKETNAIKRIRINRKIKNTEQHLKQLNVDIYDWHSNKMLGINLISSEILYTDDYLTNIHKFYDYHDTKLIYDYLNKERLLRNTKNLSDNALKNKKAGFPVLKRDMKAFYNNSDKFYRELEDEKVKKHSELTTRESRDIIDTLRRHINVYYVEIGDDLFFDKIGGSRSKNKIMLDRATALELKISQNVMLY